MPVKNKIKIKKEKSNFPRDKKFLSISEFRHLVGLPLVVVKKLVIRGEIKASRTPEGKIKIHQSEIEKIEEKLKNPRKKFKIFLKTLGPGVITGASDDDPSGIGTYSSVGAKFGLSIIWMAFWLLPMMLAVQEVCARIGIVTNRGLAGVLERHYKKRVVMVAVILLIIANVVNIGADLGAMAASLEMMTGINFIIGAILFSGIIIFLEIFVSYHIYVRVLKWLAISVLSYIVVGLMSHPNWLEVFRETFWPSIEWNSNYIFAMIAVFGTSITPYLFFWQTSEEVEENKLITGGWCSRVIHNRIHRMRTDVGTGMLLANVVFFFIVLTTAHMLFKNGIYNIDSAQQAALALKPLGEGTAYTLFSLGIIGTGLLAVPILAGSGAYALAELMKWKESLELEFTHAKGFYLVIAVSIIIGLLLNFLHINPIAALYWAAYLNGIIALPLLIVIMVVGDDKKIMGRETHPGWVRFFGWLAVIFMIVIILVSIIMSLI